MIARLLISPSIETRIKEIEKILKDAGISNPHPDLLYFPSDSKLGIEQARKMKEHFSLKPYQSKGRLAVLEDGSSLTSEAQNALLKTLEELPAEALIIIGAASDAAFLSTVLSRCQIVRLKSLYQTTEKSDSDIQQLLSSNIEERFDYIERLKNKKEFLHTLTAYFRASHLEGGLAWHLFLKELLQAEGWAAANVNIRAILEYLMLVMPLKM